MAFLFFTGSPYIMQNDNFEWVDAKAARNLHDHDVSFEVARFAFNDMFAFDRADSASITARIGIRLGMAEGRMLLCSVQLPRGPRPHYLGPPGRTT